ncbi:hypothetical protein CNR22_16045 [Sphingobacteriaceae bacterium]|nr:hypothetical protein CNR22_16045 [Sphingobacteriaceae bacterium]
MNYKFFLFFTLNCLSAFSQSSIFGSLSDSLQRPVEFCAVGLLNAKDSTVVKGNLSDAKGNFRFESVKAGNYFVKINFPGYRESASSAFFYDSLADKDLGVIVLKNKGINLDEVSVLNIKAPIEFKGGNITVNIDGSPLATGNSLYDLLARLPGVSVDNDVISIQGKPGALVYMDDRRQQMAGAQLMNLLRSINASSIEKIEVINNPPAKYDAAGSAGIISIKTKKIKVTGFSGSINGTYSQGFYENTNGGFYLNYKARKFTFFSSFNGNQGMTHNISTFDKEINYNGQTTYLNQRVTDDHDNRNTVTDIGLDWDAGQNTLVGAKVQVMKGYGNNFEKASTSISDNSLGYRQLVLEKTIPNDWLMYNYNLNAEHTFDTTGTKLKFSTDFYTPNYDSYKGKFQNIFLDSLNTPALPPNEFLNDNRLDIKLFFAKLDFEKKLSKTLNLEMGVKYNLQDIKSDYKLQRKDLLSGEYRTDTAFTNTFNYLEKVTAAYFNLSKEIKKFNFQLGLRAEQTAIKTRTKNQPLLYTRNYLNLFPAISMDYNHSKNHIFSLGYNKRIGRPDYNNLNPYIFFLDVLNYFQGNPYLKQAYAHNFNLNYSYKGSVFNSLTFTHYETAISGFTSQNDLTKVSTEHLTNLDYFQVLRYSFFIRKELKKWWTLSFNFGTYYVGYAGKLNGQAYSLSAIPHYEWLNNTFILPHDLKLELTTYYWGPWLGIATRYKARGAASIAIKKSFFKNAMACSIGVNDIFFSETFSSTADFQNQKWQRFNSNDTRRLNISLSYNFGKVKAEKREIGEQDARGKINK